MVKSGKNSFLLICKLVIDYVSKVSFPGSSSASSSSSGGGSKRSTSLKSVVIAPGARKMYINVHVFLKPLVGDLFKYVFEDIMLMKELKYVSKLTLNYETFALHRLTKLYIFLVAERFNKRLFGKHPWYVLRSPINSRMDDLRGCK